jgi:hypothetical protein
MSTEAIQSPKDVVEHLEMKLNIPAEYCQTLVGKLKVMTFCLQFFILNMQMYFLMARNLTTNSAFMPITILILIQDYASQTSACPGEVEDWFNGCKGHQ